MTDSLIISEQIEIIGAPGGVASVNPLCAGAKFQLMTGFDLGAPQPVTSIVGSLLLDGSRPFGYQAGNRTITLPVKIQAPDFQTLIAAREVLLREINQQTWTLRWTRDTTGPQAGNAQALPLLFDCFRAAATVVQWGGFDGHDRFPVGLLTLSFEALPYARSDLPVVVDFPSPLSGRTAPPAAVSVDTFSSVSGTQWAASPQSPVGGGASAFWDPTIGPADIPDGTGQPAVYSKSGLALNLGAGWTVTGQGTAAANNYIILTAADAAKAAVGQQFQLWNHAAGTLLQTQIFTVTNISAPSAGFVNVFFTPAAATATVLNNVAIQTGPPQLPALTFWAGFGSSLFYHQWARLGGRVTFAFTLTDTYGTALKFSKTVKGAGSNNSSLPRWQKIRVNVPWQPGFDYANVASYAVTVTNRGSGDLRYTQLYLSALQAVPPPVAVSPSPQRGTVYDLAGLPGSARAPVSMQFQQAGTAAVTRNLTVPGVGSILAPAGSSAVSAFVLGGGGPGFAGADGGGGGGGGGSAFNNSIAWTAGKSYFYTVGYNTGISAIASSFGGDSVTLTAGTGAAATSATGGAGGTAGAGGFAGGPGGAGTNTTVGGGGGGGGSGGSAAIGNTGGAAAGGTGGAAAAAVAGGGPGGRGGSFGFGNGISPRAGYGGGGGGSPGGATGQLYGGDSGFVQLLYNATPTFQTLLVHRPPVTAPDTLCPFVSPSVADVPDGTTAYPVASLVPGVNARFGGTYTLVLVAWSWHTPANPRALTVTVTQNEQAAGAQYTASATTTVTPSSLAQSPDTNAVYGPMVILGELTLPLNDLPQDNLNAYFTVSVTSGDTADRFVDVLFLDTQGSTVLVQGGSTGYANMWIDAPATDRDIGLIMGSVYDRSDAVSILDRAVVAGGPVSADPDGNPYLLAYSAEGAPNLQLTYYPAWILDRYL